MSAKITSQKSLPNNLPHSLPRTTKNQNPKPTNTLSAKLKRIIIIRHADSMDREVFLTSCKAKKIPHNDMLRPLSKKGKIQSEHIALFVQKSLHTQRAPISCVLTSPAKRTIQTIKPLSKVLKKVPCQLCDFIAPDCGIEGYEKAIYANDETSQTLVLVGHEPDLGEFVKYALGVDFFECLDFPKGVIIELKKKPKAKYLQAGFTLSLFIPPKYL
ncbi:SixA phosphatase family protein [Helicobacter sp. T3_23-1056]